MTTIYNKLFAENLGTLDIFTNDVLDFTKIIQIPDTALSISEMNTWCKQHWGVEANCNSKSYLETRGPHSAEFITHDAVPRLIVANISKQLGITPITHTYWLDGLSRAYVDIWCDGHRLKSYKSKLKHQHDICIKTNHDYVWDMRYAVNHPLE